MDINMEHREREKPGILDAENVSDGRIVIRDAMLNPKKVDWGRRGLRRGESFRPVSNWGDGSWDTLPSGPPADCSCEKPHHVSLPSDPRRNPAP